MVNIEHFSISIRYSNSERRGILLKLLPDESNIADVAALHNLPIEVIQGWYDMSERVLGAYQGIDVDIEQPEQDSPSKTN